MYCKVINGEMERYKWRDGTLKCVINGEMERYKWRDGTFLWSLFFDSVYCMVGLCLCITGAPWIKLKSYTKIMH